MPRRQPKIHRLRKYSSIECVFCVFFFHFCRYLKLTFIILAGVYESGDDTTDSQSLIVKEGDEYEITIFLYVFEDTYITHSVWRYSRTIRGRVQLKMEASLPWSIGMGK